MAILWTLMLSHTRISQPDWEEVRRAFEALADNDYDGGIALVEDGDGAMFIVSYDTANQLGYFVTAKERGELQELVLVDPTLGRDRVTGNIGGQGDERPRFVFVDQSLVAKALEEFYRTGRRGAGCTWLPFLETT
jgi:hypothetical protein